MGGEARMSHPEGGPIDPQGGGRKKAWRPLKVAKLLNVGLHLLGRARCLVVHGGCGCSGKEMRGSTIRRFIELSPLHTVASFCIVLTSGESAKNSRSDPKIGFSLYSPHADEQ